MEQKNHKGHKPNIDDFEEVEDFELPERKIGFKKALLGTIITIVAETLAMVVIYHVAKLGEPQENYSTYPNSVGWSQPVPEVTEYNTLTADEYYENNSQIISKISADKSESVQTEDECIEELSNRGFDNACMEALYSSDGSYTGEALQSSDNKCPCYQGYYTTPEGNLWTLFSINGRFIARPVFYDFTVKPMTKTIIAEDKTLVSYDGETNMFYETIPSPSAVTLKIVDKIDAETLNSLTIEDIDKL